MKKVLKLAAALLAVLTSCSQSPSVSLSCTEPPFLKPGDKIALISPAYHTPMTNVDTASIILRDWGFEPVVGANADKEYLGYYAGNAEERLADLEWAYRDTSIKAILCNRGGYGTLHLINKLPYSLIRNNPKWLIGFSDITTLHALSTRAGVMSLHATMCSLMAKTKGLDEGSVLLRDFLYGSIPGYEVPSHQENICGRASGILIGGNLFTFTPLLGTVADATEGGDFILFIEEVEEDMSHIDRQINELILNGVFDRCKGVILGEFTDCEANLDYESMEQMICSYLKYYDIPVLCGFPGGHGDENLPLVMGAPVTIEVTPEGSRISFDIQSI